MSSKDTIDKAYGNIPKEVATPPVFDWIVAPRSVKYYYLRVVRYFTRE
jgi:hypothetical protein